MKKILVVEDDEGLRLLYHDELAANGKEALKQLDTAHPDLVIFDIIMPRMDGMEALGKVIRKERDIAVILNTAYPIYRDDFN